MTVANVQVTQVLFKRGSTDHAQTYIGPLGEAVLDTGLTTLRLQDGVTPGGHLMATAAQANAIVGSNTYGDANVAAYLPTHTGNISAGNVLTNNYLYANGVAISFSGVTNQLVAGTATVTLANTAYGGFLYMPLTSTIQGNTSLTLLSGNSVGISSQIQIHPTSFAISSSDETIPALSSSATINASGTSGNPKVALTVVDPSSSQAQNWNFDKDGVLTLPAGAALYDTLYGSLAWGYYAGGAGPGFGPTQGSYDLAIGTFSGQINQSGYSIAIGYNSGTNNQGTNSIAIGQNTGYSDQGNNAISIGGSNGSITQVDNSIILNANATGISASTPGLFVNPVRNNYDAANSVMMVYNTVTNELTYSNIILAGIIAGRYANANVAAYLPGYAGPIGGTITTGTQTNINQVGVLNSLTTGGDATINGNLTVTGNINFIGNVTNETVTGNSGQFFGDSYGFGALYAGIASGYTIEPETIFQATANFNGFGQFNIQNINPGGQSTSDYVITADNGTNTTNYVDLGMAGSTYDTINPINGLGTSLWANDAYLYAQGNTSADPGGNLVIGATVPGRGIRFIAGGSNTENIVVLMDQPGTDSVSAATGAVVVAGGIGASGNIFTSNSIIATNTVIAAGINLVANVSSLANQIVTANTGMEGYVDTLNTAMAANVQNSLNFTVNSNAAMQSYVVDQIAVVNASISRVTTAWTNNAATQYTEIVNLDLNIISANSYSNNNINAANVSIAALSANVGSYYVYANLTQAGQNVWLSNLQSNVNSINANIGSYYIYANAAYSTVSNAALQNTWLSNLQSNVNSINANIGSYYIYANLTQAGQNVWLSNLQSNVTSISANLGSFYTYANLTYITTGGSYGDSNVASYLTVKPQPGTYSNANVAAYLPTDSTITGIQTSIANKTLSQLTNSPYTATLNSSGLFEAPTIQSDGPIVLTYSGAYNTLYKIAAVDVANFAIYGTRNTYFDTTLLTLNAVGGNATVSGNVVAPNYLFANGVNILSTVGAYGNTQVAQFLPTYTGNLSAANASVTNQFTVPFGTGQTPTDIQRIILAQTLIA